MDEDKSKLIVEEKKPTEPTPEQEKAAQEFADKMVQNIIKQLPPKPPSVADNTEVLKQLEVIRHNQYLDHLVLEKIWEELRCTDAQARIIDQLAEQETARRKKG